MVLAIAGLILVVVFMAVGGAQRANRDTQRVNEAGLIASAMESYARNNNGLYPSSSGSVANYVSKIVDVDTKTAPSFVTTATTAAAGTGEYFGSGFICDSTTPGAMKTGSARNYAISYWSEQGVTAACKDNQ
jgi:type II secretory pathway pseudopilin PulG